jgi:hypothetical protein
MMDRRDWAKLLEWRRTVAAEAAKARAAEQYAHFQLPPPPPKYPLKNLYIDLRQIPVVLRHHT